MNVLLQYIPHSADIALFKPRTFKEKLISWALHSPYCHVGLINVDRGKPPIIMEQNIDYSRHEEQPLRNYLDKYDLLILRCSSLSRWTREKVVQIFRYLHSCPYSYKDAFHAWWHAGDCFPSQYMFLKNENNDISVVRIYKNAEGAPAVEFRNRYTCTAAVGLSLYFGLERTLKDPTVLFNHKCLWYLTPNDFLESSYFSVLGMITRETAISVIGVKGETMKEE